MKNSAGDEDDPSPIEKSEEGRRRENVYLETEERTIYGHADILEKDEEGYQLDIDFTGEHVSASPEDLLTPDDSSEQNPLEEDPTNSVDRPRKVPEASQERNQPPQGIQGEERERTSREHNLPREDQDWVNAERPPMRPDTGQNSNMVSNTSAINGVIQEPQSILYATAIVGMMGALYLSSPLMALAAGSMLIVTILHYAD